MTDEELDNLYGTNPNADSVQGFIDALNIFRTYMDTDNKSFFLGAEHDEIFMYSDGPEPDSEDGYKVIALGWRYNPELAGWSKFV